MTVGARAMSARTEVCITMNYLFELSLTEWALTDLERHKAPSGRVWGAHQDATLCSQAIDHLFNYIWCYDRISLEVSGC